MREENGVCCRQRWQSGVITVFFTLLSVLFLSVIFMLIESVRIQGARAQTANITDMANMSLFGEFEQKLLNDFEVFAVDASYGSGDFSIDRMSGKLKSYMEMNADVKGDGITSMFIDLWNIQVEDAAVREYALLSDGGGENYYQQVVAYMRETVVMQSAGKLLSLYRDAKKIKEKQEEYEQVKELSGKQMDALEQKEKEKTEELQKQAESEAAEDGSADLPAVVEPQEKMRNPLPAIWKLMRRDILSIVCGDAEISDGSTGFWTLPSRRRLKKGNLTLKKEYGGMTDNLLFREYMLDHFPYWNHLTKDGELRYGLEYIIGGKRNDRANLKSAVRKLLLLRETCNYIYSSGDAEMSAATENAAMLIIGWLGIPELVSVLKHGLLLGWSYGESLLDVRTLMKGGKVPLLKESGDWELQLENLADIQEMLVNGRKQSDKGSDYKEHLRILLYMQSISTQKKRALDMVEVYVKRGSGLSNYKVDNCVVAVRDTGSLSIKPMFSKVSGIWMGVMGSAMKVTVRGGYAY